MFPSIWKGVIDYYFLGYAETFPGNVTEIISMNVGRKWRCERWYDYKQIDVVENSGKSFTCTQNISI